jgi:hypothetical protein
MRGALPMSEPFIRDGPCPHTAVSDEAIAEREDLIEDTWGDAGPIKCPDCNERLYPHHDGVAVTVYTEPYGAGRE